MKLGTFCTNCSGGTVASTAEGTLEVTWPRTKALAQVSDRAGFEAIVPVGRWKGFGGLTDFNGVSFEVYTWAAGLAEATSTVSHKFISGIMMASGRRGRWPCYVHSMRYS